MKGMSQTSKNKLIQKNSSGHAYGKYLLAEKLLQWKDCATNYFVFFFKSDNLNTSTSCRGYEKRSEIRFGYFVPSLTHLFVARYVAATDRFEVSRLFSHQNPVDSSVRVTSRWSAVALVRISDLDHHDFWFGCLEVTDPRLLNSNRAVNGCSIRIFSFALVESGVGFVETGENKTAWKWMCD